MCKLFMLQGGHEHLQYRCRAWDVRLHISFGSLPYLLRIVIFIELANAVLATTAGQSAAAECLHACANNIAVNKPKGQAQHPFQLNIGCDKSNMLSDRFGST